MPLRTESADQPPIFSIVLASASPRRQELLVAAGIRFEACPAEVAEAMRSRETAEAYVRRVAREKAEAVAARRPGESRPIVGADTVVLVKGAVLGKPASAADAARMLRMLGGRTHEVLTGLCVLEPFPGGRRLLEAVRTRVRFAPLSEEEVAAYVATGEPLDKAGAYAIQGRASRFVEWIDGCYFNVVGLPVPTLYRLLKRLQEP